jgi:uncharacterized RDD family membrane protein YckC
MTHRRERPPPVPDDRGPVEGIVVSVARLGRPAIRLVVRPVRAVARSPLVRPATRALAEQGRRGLEAAADEVLTAPETARVLDAALAGPLPEEVARAAVEHRVPQRMAASLVEDDTLEEAVVSALENGKTEELARRLTESPAFERILVSALQSPEMQRVLVSVASSPAVRTALTRQTAGFAEEIAGSLRGHASALDDRVEHTARRAVRRGPRPEPAAGPDYGGIVTRALALALDTALAFLGVLVVGAILGLVALLVGQIRPQWLVGLVLGSAWIVGATAYFTLFWSTTGQTPGMRLFRVRVIDRNRGRPPGLLRSLVRFAGLLLAIVPCFAGFLPVLVDDRRRGLPDYLAGTVVACEEPAPVDH